ncbi:tripeptidyl-peptidase II Tpp2 [Coemansia sp. RSA 485]|nr:tripeptidyl-peptidase II Tpp2 [Coemansia sp. RSA 485]
MEVKASDYPSAGMLPKGLTQVDEFLSKNPTFDGRDTVVAILDTGIDPAAIGMQTTSTGKPKVVDFIDCTGIGDVQMEPAQKCSDKNPLELVGASGRTLKLNPNWKNPSGDWYVGSKSLYSIAPAEVTGELGKERRMLHTEKHEAMQLSIAKHQQQHGDGDYSSAKIEALDNLKRLYQDCGPLLDCVVFHDGNQWLAAIDTEESGDFAEIPAMGAYKSTGDVGMLCKRHLLYYTVNFYDNGKILSIVTPPHIHSTHVSGIAAAFDPEEPVYMGIAPGAQILSLSVGDKRTGMMETGIGLIRAVNAIIEYNVDVANMSYGEPSSTSNEARVDRLLTVAEA